MTELTKLLVTIPDVYDDFIIAVVDYASKKVERAKILSNYIISNKNVTTSDVIQFMVSQPDFDYYARQNKQTASEQ